MAELQVPEWQDSAIDTNKDNEKEADNQHLVTEEEEKFSAGDEPAEEAEEENDSGTQEEEIPVKENSAPESGQDDEAAVFKALSELGEKMDQMNRLFVQKIQHTAHEETIVNQMHAELQRYKDDMYAQLVRPILLDIIEIRDSIRRVSESFASKAEEERVVPLKTFSDYTFDIQDILEKNNIIIYDSKEGDSFNPLKQRAIKKVTTPVEELRGKVAESLSSGYEYMGKTISPEKVVVYVYQKSESTEGEN